MGHCCQLFSDVPAVFKQDYAMAAVLKMANNHCLKHAEIQRLMALDHHSAIYVMVLLHNSNGYLMEAQIYHFSTLTQGVPRGFSTWHIFIFFTFVSLSWYHLSTWSQFSLLCWWHSDFSTGWNTIPISCFAASICGIKYWMSSNFLKFGYCVMISQRQSRFMSQHSSLSSLKRYI